MKIQQSRAVWWLRANLSLLEKGHILPMPWWMYRCSVDHRWFYSSRHRTLDRPSIRWHPITSPVESEVDRSSRQRHSDCNWHTRLKHERTTRNTQVWYILHADIFFTCNRFILWQRAISFFTDATFIWTASLQSCSWIERFKCRINLPQWFMKTNSRCWMENDLTVFDQQLFVSDAKTIVRIENITLQSGDFLVELWIHFSNESE